MNISIIIPIYNREDWVSRMFKRLLDLELEHAEVIIVDDGSIDRTLERLQQFSTDKFELKIFTQKNSGPASARNLGFKYSEGKYIQFLDSDDFLTPNKISEQVQYLENSPEVDVVYGSWRMGELWENSKIIKAQDNKDMVVNLLLGKFNPNFSYLFRREIVESVHGWDEHHRLNDDFDFTLRIAVAGAKFHCVQELVTGFYQWHPYERLSRQSDIANANATYPILENAISMCKKKHALNDSRRHAFASCFWHLAVKALPGNENIFIQGMNIARRIDNTVFPQTLFVKIFGLSKYAKFVNFNISIRNKIKNIAIGVGVRKLIHVMRKIQFGSE